MQPVMFNPSAVPNPNLNYQLPGQGPAGGAAGPTGGGGGPDRDGDNRKLVYQWICELSWLVIKIINLINKIKNKCGHTRKGAIGIVSKTRAR